MTRLATVLETRDQIAKVSVSAQDACDHCGDHGACSITGPPPGSRIEEITARNPIAAQVGDTVEIDLPPRGELKLSFLVWVVPLFGVIGGAVAGALLAGQLDRGQDLPTLLGAALGFAAAYLWLRRLDRTSAGDPRLSPYIVRVVQAPSCGRAAKPPAG